MWTLAGGYSHKPGDQAYFRLKVDDNSVADPVASISVDTGGKDVLVLKGTDFAASGVYQEFALDFQNHDPDWPWFAFGASQIGNATVHVDRMVIFTAPEPVQADKTWDVPDHNYRGKAVWGRYTNNAGNFSGITEATTTYSQLEISSASLTFLGDDTLTVPAMQTLTVGYGTGCDRPPWSVQSSQPWLKVNAAPPNIQVWVDSTGLPLGAHQATLAVDAGPDIAGSPQTVPVTFILVEELQQVFLPRVSK